MKYYKYEITISCVDEVDAGNTYDTLVEKLVPYAVKVELHGVQVSVIGAGPLERAIKVMGECEGYGNHAIYMNAYDKVNGVSVSAG